MSKENEDKAHNVNRGKKDAARQYKWVGGPPPLGYRLRNVMIETGRIEEIDHRVIEPDPQISWIVERIFHVADTHGWGMTRIARMLNADPTVPESCKPFHATTIGRILDNAIYYGELIWAKNATGIVDDVRIQNPNPESLWLRVENYCEPIISRELWDRVQSIRAARRHRNRVAEARSLNPDRITGLCAPGIALKYILSGLVRCRHCNRAMTPTSSSEYHSRDGIAKRYVAYACPGAPDGTCTNRKRIPEDWLRATVVQLLRTQLFFDQ